MNLATLASKLPPSLRPVLIAVVAGVAVAALMLHGRSRARRIVRVEPRAPRPEREVPWGE